MENFEQEFTKAVHGEYYECIFLRDQVFKILGKTETQIVYQVTAKKIQTAQTGLGECVTTSFTKWIEKESSERIFRGFKQGEYLIVDNPEKFFEI